VKLFCESATTLGGSRIVVKGLLAPAFNRNIPFSSAGL
jgi:hypothetical protein